MAISKKLRFEVFKRDGFCCAYCGNKPPQVMLEVDHIIPTSKGGKDDINNLTTSCFECNRGKSNILLNLIPSQLKMNLEILKEKELQLKEYTKLCTKIERRLQNDIGEIEKVFSTLFPNRIFTEQFKRYTLKRFLNYISKEEIINALIRAYDYMPKYKKEDEYATRTIKYFCGICWRIIKNNEQSVFSGK